MPALWQKTKRNWKDYSAGFFYCLFGLFIWSHIIGEWRDYRGAQGWKAVAGKNVRVWEKTHRTRKGTLSSSYYAQYQYEYQGNLYTGRQVSVGDPRNTHIAMRYNAWHKLEEAGAQQTSVTVWVNPANPNESVFDKSWPFGVGTVVWGVIGFYCLLPALAWFVLPVILWRPKLKAESSLNFGQHGIGILFDIDALKGGLYGFSAYKLFFDAIDPRLIAGGMLSDGDTSQTVAGRQSRYCIAVQSLSASQLETVKDRFSRLDAEELAPLPQRFIEGQSLAQEPLAHAGRIDTGGEFLGGGWAIKAWQAVRQKYR